MKHVLSNILIILSLALFGAANLTSTYAQELDDATGLVIAEGWQLIKSTCSRCHSTRLIVQNSGTREVWRSRLIWMQQTQGLEIFSPAMEEKVLDYLTTNYGQKTISRRPGLPAMLLPPNPYGNAPGITQ